MNGKVGIGEEGAFPNRVEPGMTYKQWLIGQALAGRMASLGNAADPALYRAELIARDCLRAVEAVLAELEKIA